MIRGSYMYAWDEIEQNVQLYIPLDSSSAASTMMASSVSYSYTFPLTLNKLSALLIVSNKTNAFILIRVLFLQYDDVANVTHGKQCI